jgi:hypothetical protein
MALVVVLVACGARVSAETEAATPVRGTDPPVRNYAAKMAAIDVLLLFGTGLAITLEAVDEGGSVAAATPFLYGIWTFAGPARHLYEDNWRQA